MALPEQITQNPLFMLSLMAPLAPMAIAVLILLVRFVRSVYKGIVTRRQQRKLKQTQQLDDLQEDSNEQFNNPDDLFMVLAAEGIPLPEEQESDSATQSASDVSSDIMQLINDVFVDDGKSELNEILLHETEDVTTQELLTLAQNLARQMGIDSNPKTS